MREGLEYPGDLLCSSPEAHGGHRLEIPIEETHDAQTAARERALDRFAVELLLSGMCPSVRAGDTLRVDDLRSDKGDTAGLEAMGPHLVQESVDGLACRIGRRLASAPPSHLTDRTASSQLLMIGVE
jgi:hypothetical protein